jgi:hypothetical protein
METGNEIKNIWTIVCKNSSVDKNSNSLSIFNILEEIQLTKNPNVPVPKEGIMPAAPLAYEIITLWSRETKSDNELTANMQTELLDPTNKVLQSNVSEIKFEKDKSRLRIIVKALGLPITTGGTYHFRVSLKKAADKEYKYVSQVSLEVKIK